ncbi:hypothetical protein CRV03_01680 [Arcobacter sp. F155]|uniref:hypothetical protein n=1 Tax=Arcobacter sp. F155 TaxID=2044512 RepID=UPI00100B903E|nr:hypothetical protein [Arcobacter sp. F155]RXJ78763.1 hypothetical protein CRV03_01680 [Arcobacter sp. F155]
MVEQKIISNSTYWYDKVGKTQEFSKVNDLTIISADNTGNTISYFYDDIWDLSSYSINSTRTDSKLDFGQIEKALRKQAKTIAYMILMYGKSRFGRQLEAKTIKGQYFRGCIVPISKWLTEKNLNFSDFFSDESILFQYVKHQISMKKDFIHLPAFFKFLSNTYHESFPYKIVINKKTKTYLDEARKIREKNKKQTPIIPSRILSYAIEARWNHIDYIFNHIDELSNFIENYMNQKADHEKPQKRFLNAVNFYKLEDLFKKYNINNRAEFITFIKQLQATSKNLIHTYSGMRSEEAYSLNINSFKQYNSKSFIIGFTTKLDGRQKETRWVTLNKIKIIFKIFKKINISILKKHKNFIILNNPPLFLSVNFLRLNNMESLSLCSLEVNNELYLDESKVILTPKDLEELESIDPFRNWTEEDKFQLDSRWCFTTHQYRRSLSVYSIKSGLVSIGALQIQLKHLFRDMTLYYSNGATNNVNIDKLYSEDLIKTLKNTKPEIKTLEFIKNVIFSDEKLFGSYGKKIELKKSAITSNYTSYILEDKQKTLKLFQNGDLYYKETALGGCISVDPCDSFLTNSLTECFSCDCGILKKSKIEKVITKEKNLLAQFERESIEYKTINMELNQLKSLYQKVNGENNE